MIDLGLKPISIHQKLGVQYWNLIYLLPNTSQEKYHSAKQTLRRIMYASYSKGKKEL